MFDVKQEPVSLQDSNLARSLMNLVEIQMKDIHEEDTKYIKSWLIVSATLLKSFQPALQFSVSKCAASFATAFFLVEFSI